MSKPKSIDEILNSLTLLMISLAAGTLAWFITKYIGVEGGIAYICYLLVYFNLPNKVKERVGSPERIQTSDT